MKAMLFYFMLITTAFAREGHEGGGGGDPIAAQFAWISSYVADYMEQNPSINPTVSRRALQELATDIQNSLHVSSKVGKIEVVDGGAKRIMLAQRSPLYIKISRQGWDMNASLFDSNLKSQIKDVTDLMVKLATPTDPNEIPMPENPIDAYSKAYGECALSVKIVKKYFDDHINGMNKCIGQLNLKLAMALKDTDLLIRKNVVLCKSSCVHHKQVLSGAEACAAYLDLHEQNMSDYKMMAPECLL